MALLTKSRRDGSFVKAQDVYNIIMPYIMPTRAASLVYYTMHIDVANARAYLQKQRKLGKDISFFNLVIAAAAKALEAFPRANRFIAGQRLYLHNTTDICYTVKREMSVQATETTAKIRVEPGVTVDSVCHLMQEATSGKKGGEEGFDDKMAKFFARVPRFLVNLFVWTLRSMNYFGILPHAVSEALPFFSSVFVANLGSLGMNAPLHHLYEFGTCSLFLTMGRLNKEFTYDENGKRVGKLTIDLGMTVDERIVDGFYLSRVIACFTRYLQNPELIDAPVTPVE